MASPPDVRVGDVWLQYGDSEYPQTVVSVAPNSIAFQTQAGHRYRVRRDRFIGWRLIFRKAAVPVASRSSSQNDAGERGLSQGESPGIGSRSGPSRPPEDSEGRDG